MKTLCLFIILTACTAFSQTDVNKLDESGQKHGLWKGIFAESKRPRYEGTFNHGKETGIFTYFDDTKAQSIIATRTFNDQDQSAYTVFYDQKKNIVSEGKVINRDYDGDWKYYHEAAKTVMTLEHYKNGKLQGLRSVYYPSTLLAEETNYVDGIKQGSYKKYTEKGIVLESANYKNGNFDGQAVYKDPTGNTVAQGKYVDGKKKGIWQFYENGKLVSEENMSKPNKIRFQKKKI